MAFQTENQTWQKIITLVNMALTKAGITGWAVLQNYQPSQGTYTKPHVLIHKLMETYIGHLQNPSFKSTGGGQLTQWTLQIDAIRDREETDSADVMNGADVLQYIRFYFLSDEGARELRDQGFNVFFINQAPEAQFKTENETYQLDPNITVNLVFKQNYEQPAAAIRAVNPTIKGV